MFPYQDNNPVSLVRNILKQSFSWNELNVTRSHFLLFEKMKAACKKIWINMSFLSKPNK
jgi:hypothetical protein